MGTDKNKGEKKETNGRRQHQNTHYHATYLNQRSFGAAEVFID